MAAQAQGISADSISGFSTLMWRQCTYSCFQGSPCIQKLAYCQGSIQKRGGGGGGGVELPPKRFCDGTTTNSLGLIQASRAG